MFKIIVFSVKKKSMIIHIHSFSSCSNFCRFTEKLQFVIIKTLISYLTLNMDTESQFILCFSLLFLLPLYTLPLTLFSLHLHHLHFSPPTLSLSSSSLLSPLPPFFCHRNPTQSTPIWSPCLNIKRKVIDTRTWETSSLLTSSSFPTRSPLAWSVSLVQLQLLSCSVISVVFI